MSTLSERLKKIRTEAKISQREMSEFFDIPQTTWNNYENTKSKPNLTLFDSICTRFQVNLEWLLFGRGEMRPSEAGSREQATPMAVPAPEAAKNAPPCARCADITERLLTAHERLNQAHERLDQSHESERELLKENGELKVENAELKLENEYLKSELSLFVGATGESTQTSAA